MTHTLFNQILLLTGTFVVIATLLVLVRYFRTYRVPARMVLVPAGLVVASVAVLVYSGVQMLWR